MQQAILQYLEALQAGDHNRIIALFSPQALIHSPLYGHASAQDFYKNLLSDTQASQIILRNMFASLDAPAIFSALFRYEWILKDGSEVTFDCVDIFVFNEVGKIKELTIIYDTYHVRQSFEKL
jgi:hypothetical protein